MTKMEFGMIVYYTSGMSVMRKTINPIICMESRMVMYSINGLILMHSLTYRKLNMVICM